jgi:hypothetical protein
MPGFWFSTMLRSSCCPGQSLGRQTQGSFQVSSSPPETAATPAGVAVDPHCSSEPLDLSGEVCGGSAAFAAQASEPAMPSTPTWSRSRRSRPAPGFFAV